jgi:hypothetical protein
VVRPLLAEVAANKEDAIAFLKLRGLPEVIPLEDFHHYAHRLTPEEWRRYYPLELEPNRRCRTGMH